MASEQESGKAARGIKIGRLARLAGVGAETLRYYERLGLIEPVCRTRSNYRVYDEEAEHRLLFIRRAQTLGFSLEEIRELLSLHDRAEASAAEVRRITLRRARQVETKIRDLQRMHAGLTALAASCSGRGPASECPILGSLGGLA